MHQCRCIDARSKSKLEWQSLSISFSRYQLVDPVTYWEENYVCKLRKCSRPQKPDPISDRNCQNLHPFSDQNGSKTIPFGAAHTYIPYIGEYPPPPRVYSVHPFTIWNEFSARYYSNLLSVIKVSHNKPSCNLKSRKTLHLATRPRAVIHEGTDRQNESCIVPVFSVMLLIILLYKN